jgi:hypothetical protein
MNSFAMIFGSLCVDTAPPKAALATLCLFYGIGISGESDMGWPSLWHGRTFAPGRPLQGTGISATYGGLYTVRK